MSILIPKTLSFFFSSSKLSGARNVSSDGSSFDVQLNDPIQIPTGAVGATLEVTQASIWNNSFNISEEIGNNIFRYSIDAGVTWVDIKITDGQYSLSALQDVISFHFLSNALAEDLIQIGATDSTQKTYLAFKDANLQVDLSYPNSVRDVLGFDARKVPLVPTADPGEIESGDDIARFNRVNSYLIRGNLVSNGIPVNNTAAGIIASVPIIVGPGSQISYSPAHPIQTNANELVGTIKNYFSFNLLEQDS
jgi:hypothetical protein